ncbi:unnamed protein product [Didymodactylos carnosus]|uniref:Uncharacterized protein n=1 Tax=Didymodactylos carnosus TaxID=1234261 RepID=A0A815WYI4_9BILA|nr:unnamed protein product [Didymodactylos carnosus]CAF1551539.1 unnamed protein product [Didymodactylos carnosus]CAF4252947.1 unnamed protein product [Didymodactylos carnosus]CAF4412602.1 unnamed protein product [Didymodactylos carnosus]
MRRLCYGFVLKWMYKRKKRYDYFVYMIFIILVFGILSLIIGQSTQLSSSSRHSRYDERDLFLSTLRGRLIRQDKTVIASEIDHLTNYLRKKQLRSHNGTYIAHKCPTFATKDVFYKYKITDKEANFPIAFTILMYDNLFQFEQLLRTIYRPHNFYCIHVDLKTSQTIYNVVKRLVKCLENVCLSPARYNVTWSRYSVLEAERECQKYLLKFPQRKYYLNLAGSDFPLKTNLEIVQILKLLNNQNDITSMPYSQLEQNRKQNHQQVKTAPFTLVIYIHE